MTVLIIEKTPSKISQVARLDNVYSILETTNASDEPIYRMNVTGSATNYDYRKSVANIAVLFE